MMNLKEFGIEQSWSHQCIDPPFAWRNSAMKRERKENLRISDVSAEIRAGCLTNTSLNSDTVSKNYESHQDVSYLKTF
jgi:hypothetical protein